MRTTKRSVNTRIKEHKANCRLGQIIKSAIAEHALTDELGHYIKFDETQLLARKKKNGAGKNGFDAITGDESSIYHYDQTNSNPGFGALKLNCHPQEFEE